MKINELGGQALLILYEEGQFINLTISPAIDLLITFILASIYSDVRGEGGRALTAPCLRHCARV